MLGDQLLPAHGVGGVIGAGILDILGDEAVLGIEILRALRRNRLDHRVEQRFGGVVV